MNNLRILYSIPDQLDPSSGANELVAWHNVRCLAQLGAKVTVFCTSCAHPPDPSITLHQTLRLGPCRIPHRLLGHGRAEIIHDWQVAHALHQHANQFDAIHCWPSGSLATLQLARQQQIPTFLERPNTHTRSAIEVVQAECRKIGLHLPPSHSHARDEARLAREEEEFSLADWLLCPSDHVAASFLKQGFPPEKLLRHHYGYDPSLFTPSDPRDPLAPLTVAFVGRCEPRKGLHHALCAWLASDAASSGTFFICGRFVPGYDQLLAPQLTHPSIRYLGFLSDIQNLMRRCDILILPSLEEGSALVTYEARACGCVLLVSDATGAPAHHMHDSLIHPAGDASQLRDHLNLLTHDRSLLLRLRTNSIAALPNLTWTAAAHRLLDIYSYYATQQTPASLAST